MQTRQSRIPDLCGADFRVKPDKAPHIILDGDNRLLGVIAFDRSYVYLRMPYKQRQAMEQALLKHIGETPELAERYSGLLENRLVEVFTRFDERYTYSNLTDEQLKDPSVVSLQHLVAELDRAMQLVHASPTWADKLREFNHAAIFFCEMMCDAYTVGQTEELKEKRPLKRGVPTTHLDAFKRTTQAVFLYLQADALSAEQVHDQARIILFDYFDGVDFDTRAIAGYKAFTREIGVNNPELTPDGTPALIEWQSAVEDILVARFTPDDKAFVDGLSGKEVAVYIQHIKDLHDDAKLRAVIAVAHYAKTEGEKWTPDDKRAFSHAYILMGVILPDDKRPPLDLGEKREPKSPPPRRAGAPVRAPNPKGDGGKDPA